MSDDAANWSPKALGSGTRFGLMIFVNEFQDQIRRKE